VKQSWLVGEVIWHLPEGCEESNKEIHEDLYWTPPENSVGINMIPTFLVASVSH
jgi:hypothetical protein